MTDLNQPNGKISEELKKLNSKIASQKDSDRKAGKAIQELPDDDNFDISDDRYKNRTQISGKISNENLTGISGSQYINKKGMDELAGDWSPKSRHKGGFTFIHIPKTGGTSISEEYSFITQEDSMYKIDWEQTPWAPMPTYQAVLKEGKETFAKLHIHNHFTAEQIKKMKPKNFTPGWEDTVAMVRNPFDRLVSLYYYGKSFWKYKEGYNLPPYPNFKDWVIEQLTVDYKAAGFNTLHDMFSKIRSEAAWLSRDNSNWFTPELLHVTGHLPHFKMPQFYWLTDTNNNMIVKYLAKLENIKKEIFRKGINSIRPSSHYSDHYDDQTLALATEYYQMDLIHFNYIFEQPESIDSPEVAAAKKRKNDLKSNINHPSNR